MKCNTPIDPETKYALYGDELEAALKDLSSPRCGHDLSADDVFCPACGAKVEQLVLSNSTAKSGHGTSIEKRKKDVAKRATRFDFWIASVFFFLTNLLWYRSSRCRLL